MNNSTISGAMSDLSIGDSLVLSVHVFKTNIDSAGEVEKIAAVLSAETRIIKWNIDAYDVDNVLRVESNELTSNEIAELVRNAGCYCEELPD